MNDEIEGQTSAGRPRRRDLLIGGGALAAATVATVAVASPASAVAAPQVPVYMPAGPQRVYDSRDGDGPLFSSEGRIIGPTDTLDPSILAFTFNLTVTGTTGTGFLAVFPADIQWPGNSSINWFGPNQILANNVFTAFDMDGNITVLLGGGGSTDFVLDIVAVSQLVDVTTPTSVANRSKVASPFSMRS
jgi:hypothetical protein